MILFGTLLWIDEKNHSAVNNKNKNIHSYFRQVDLLAKTLRAAFGCELVVFTNDPARITGWQAKNPKTAPLRLVPIISSMAMPDGISFYAAHHKIDALIAGKSLLTDDADRLILLDTDMIARHAFSREQIMMVESADLVVYDISDQFFLAYGAARVQHDIHAVAGESFADPRWFGGEMIVGSAQGLQELIRKAQAVLPRYFASISELHHSGDEMFMTAALNSLRAQKNALRIVEQSPYRIVSRHWSRHSDRSFGFHMRHSFVHCPGSKPALEYLSLFARPSPCFIYAALKLYHYAVRFYQWIKRFT